jgi:predicted nucleotidyltransferase
LATLRLRDRDAIITKEGLVFRVLGYAHLQDAFICDIEYAPATVFTSDDPRAFRSNGKNVFYKFYEDEGWKFLQASYSQYLIFHEMLQSNVIGVKQGDIARVRKPDEELQKLDVKPKDKLVVATQRILELVAERSGISNADFGVFGSMLHGFHHPEFSDIDLIIYGRTETTKLRKTLLELYEDDSSLFRNEFETDQSIRGKRWRFRNLSIQEYLWHQRRKLIYALFSDENSRRWIKTEFESVMDWREVVREYDFGSRVFQRGWVIMKARIIEDRDSPFIPSAYGVEALEVLEGPREALEASRIVSYLEEFRLQVFKDEIVYVEGNLEEVVTSKGRFYQIALTYCPKYYEQVLKSLNCRGVS